MLRSKSTVAAARLPRTWIMCSENPGENEKFSVTPMDAGTGLHAPSAEEPCPPGRSMGFVACTARISAGADQIEHVGDRVRPDFENDISWLAKHPKIERSGLQLAQALVPRNRNLVGSAEPPRG